MPAYVIPASHTFAQPACSPAGHFILPSALHASASPSLQVSSSGNGLRGSPLVFSKRSHRGFATAMCNNRPRQCRQRANPHMLLPKGRTAPREANPPAAPSNPPQAQANPPARPANPLAPPRPVWERGLGVRAVPAQHATGAGVASPPLLCRTAPAPPRSGHSHAAAAALALGPLRLVAQLLAAAHERLVPLVVGQDALLLHARLEPPQQLLKVLAASKPYFHVPVTCPSEAVSTRLPKGWRPSESATTDDQSAGNGPF